MAQTRKSTKKTSTKKKASSTKKKTAATKASSAATSAAKPAAQKSSTKPAAKSSKPVAKSAKPAAKKPVEKRSTKPTEKRSTKPTEKRSKPVDRSETGSATKAESENAISAPRAKPRFKVKRSSLPPGLNVVRGLADVLEEYGLDELVYDTSELTVTLKRSRIPGLTPEQASAVGPLQAVGGQAISLPTLGASPMLIPSPPPPPPPDPDKFLERSGADPSDEEAHHVIKSPFVGTFYRRPSPDTDPYVTLGMRVSKGQVLCIVEAMKLMNEIECDASGRIADILVEDAQPVEYGQALFKITYG